MPEPMPPGKRVRRDEYRKAATESAPQKTRPAKTRPKPEDSSEGHADETTAGPSSHARALKRLDADQLYQYQQAVQAISRWQDAGIPPADHEETLASCGLPVQVTSHLDAHGVKTVGQLKHTPMEVIRIALSHGLAENRFKHIELMKFHRGLDEIIRLNVNAGAWKEKA